MGPLGQAQGCPYAAVARLEVQIVTGLAGQGRLLDVGRHPQAVGCRPAQTRDPICQARRL